MPKQHPLQANRLPRQVGYTPGPPTQNYEHGHPSFLSSPSGPSAPSFLASSSSRTLDAGLEITPLSLYSKIPPGPSQWYPTTPGHGETQESEVRLGIVSELPDTRGRVISMPPAQTTSFKGKASRQDADPPEAGAILEEKRQRNTAASARFRVRKKERNMQMERALADLSTRADELEREASDLRRENTLLKEIVIMKGRHNLNTIPPPGVSTGRGNSHTTSRMASSSMEGPETSKDDYSSSGGDDDTE